ncbi:MAG: M23 family metallopeptidase [Candidatus Hydrogenedentes bacterium]|nr:M23 family metallopeptidase [Candidatus Hydrogenedentota bacterium]
MPVLALYLAMTAAAGGGYLWPLELPPQLTSSFGEYRSGRYHAGIDLRTGGIGIPVYAAQDGYVSRVRCSPYGYGKAVYVQFTDGNSVVYGHLDDYPDELRAYVRAAQHKARSYTVDLYPEAGQFPVRQGDLVAKSGATGIGAPHLHYELRDANQHPINPRLLGVDWPDNTPPILRQIVIVPGDANSSVEGGHLPVIRDLTDHGNGRYTAAPVQAEGNIGFAIDLVDHAGSTAYKLDAWQVKVATANSEIFRVQLDRISYDTNQDGSVSWHPYLLDRGRFRVLWRWDGNESDPYQHTPAPGWYAVPTGETEIILTAVDFMGNVAESRLPIVPGRPKVNAVAEKATTRGKVDVRCEGVFLTVLVEFDGAEEQAPEAALFGPAGNSPLLLERIGPGRFSAGWAAPKSGNYTLRVSHPRIDTFEKAVTALVRGDAVNNLACGPVRISAPADAAYGAVYLWAEETTRPASALPLYGKAYRIAPENAAIDSDLEIAFPLPEGLGDTDHIDIYRSASSRIATRYAGGAAVIKTGRLGTFVLAEDSEAPRISDVSPPPNYKAQSRRPIIHASISDSASGVESYDIFLDEQWILTAYDPEHGKITWERDEDLPSGTHTLRYRVTDGAGNVATESRTLVIP